MRLMMILHLLQQAAVIPWLWERNVHRTYMSYVWFIEKDGTHNKQR